MKRKKLLLIILSLALLLAACGKPQDASPAPLAETPAYTAETIPCDLPMSALSASCASGGVLYLAGTVEDCSGLPEDGDGGEITYNSTVSTSSDDGETSFVFGEGMKAVLCRLDPASGEVTPMEGYAPEPGASAAALAPGADGTLWVLEQTMGGQMEDVSEGFSYFNAAPASQVWRNLSADGSQELARIDITQDAGDAAVTASMIDGAGRLCCASGSTVTVLDGETGARFTCGGQGEIDRLIPLADGAVGAVTTDGEGRRTVLPIDPGAKGWGTPRPLTGNASEIFAGDENHEFLYTSGDSLYGWPKGGNGPQKLLSWSGAGIDCGQVFAMTFLPDGRGAALLRDSSGWPMTASAAVLTPVSPEELAGRTVLTLATMGLSGDTRARVMEFNRSSSQYRVEIQDYSEFNTAEDASAGLTKLNTEILAGKMPDLLDVSAALPLRQYAAKGYLEDLWPYIDADPDLGREKVMERALQSAGMNGKLYQLFSAFTLETLVGAPAAVGDRMGWSLEDLKTALSKQKSGCGILDQNETAASIFESLFGDDLDRFVDWDAGTAGFNAPAFREILEFCASFPSQPGTADDGLDAVSRAVQGGQLLLREELCNFNSVQIDNALFGGDAAYVGCPGAPDGGARFRTSGGLALSSACKDKDGAWSFLRKLLLPAGKDFFPEGFPVNREDFERAAEEAMKVEYVKDETGNPVAGPDGEPVMEGQGYVFTAGQVIPIGPVKQEEYDQLMAVYNAAGSLLRRDEKLWAIIQECAGAYFAGDKGLEETAAAIQNRAALYVNEQK